MDHPLQKEFELSPSGLHFRVPIKAVLCLHGNRQAQYERLTHHDLSLHLQKYTVFTSLLMIYYVFIAFLFII